MKRADNPSERGEKIKTERVEYARVLWHMQRSHDIRCFKHKQEGRGSRFVLIFLHSFLPLLSFFWFIHHFGRNYNTMLGTHDTQPYIQLAWSQLKHLQGVWRRRSGVHGNHGLEWQTDKWLSCGVQRKWRPTCSTKGAAGTEGHLNPAWGKGPSYGTLLF